jgi:hypothetical protein
LPLTIVDEVCHHLTESRAAAILRLRRSLLMDPRPRFASVSGTLATGAGSRRRNAMVLARVYDVRRTTSFVAQSRWPDRRLSQPQKMNVDTDVDSLIDSSIEGFL